MPQTHARASARIALLVCILTAGSLHAQTFRLNDTGQTLCDDGNNVLVACTSANTGDASPMPRQDGRFGRDRAAAAGRYAKTGAGAAGFDFTRLCWNGQAEGTAGCTGPLVANTSGAASASPSTDWACTLDNVTGLVWSLQSQMETGNTARGAGFGDPGHNAAARCGYSAGWRLPAVRELLSIVHSGSGSGPTVDADFFPATLPSWYWAAESFVGQSGDGWVVDFDWGESGFFSTGEFHLVRLVHTRP